MTAGIIAIFAGYTIASYGIILLKGWDVPWREWVNPLNPWTWPSGQPPHVPSTRVLP